MDKGLTTLAICGALYAGLVTNVIGHSKSSSALDFNPEPSTEGVSGTESFSGLEQVLSHHFGLPELQDGGTLVVGNNLMTAGDPGQRYLDHFFTVQSSGPGEEAKYSLDFGASVGTLYLNGLSGKEGNNAEFLGSVPESVRDVFSLYEYNDLPNAILDTNGVYFKGIVEGLSTGGVNRLAADVTTYDISQGERSIEFTPRDTEYVLTDLE